MGGIIQKPTSVLLGMGKTGQKILQKSELFSLSTLLGVTALKFYDVLSMLNEIILCNSNHMQRKTRPQDTFISRILGR